jgi:2-polyprenyl-6-methoxyphenol hydroxylase-like FAD-dependent oxidoreductase
MQRVTVRCCVAGGGPAGVMAGLLLARAGVDVVVLEKHADFFRDFRGDTIHPSTLELMDELGCFEALMKVPHQKAHHLSFQFGDVDGMVADFDRTRMRHPFVAFMPQWDFLDFLARRAARYPTFSLKMSADVTGIIEENGVVVGVTATTPRGPLEVRADLVIAADGRHSTVRDQSGLVPEERGAPMDVLWFGIERRPTDPEEVMGRFLAGSLLIAIDRRDYWQCGYVIPKDSFDGIQASGLDAFRQTIARSFPVVADRVGQLDTWDKIKLLTVQVNRLKRWYRPGLLCIGDAAHAMSPVGGVGINLAVQDAVAASNILTEALLARRTTVDDLAKVQKRREFPMRVTQAFQILVQNRVLAPALGGTLGKPPLAMRLLQWFPALRALPARWIGLGVRPEHIQTTPRWPDREPPAQA